MTIDTPPRTVSDEDALRLSAVSKTFTNETGGEVLVLDNVSFSVRRGELMSLVGPSGCGKTTAFNIIAGLTPATRGEVLVGGRELKGSRGHVGYMMQRDLLLPWRTVASNIGLGLELAGVPKQKRQQIATAQLRDYGMERFADSHPAVLSGGMRQRVALIRTLVMEPDILLLDEPFSALDYQTRVILEEELLRVTMEQGLTTVLVTHDIGEAVALADRVVVMSKGPGRVKSVYDVGMARRLRSVVAAREDEKFAKLFAVIWEDLDIQMDLRKGDAVELEEGAA